MLAELATISSIGKENSREGAWMCSDGPISGKVIICHTHILSGENAQAIYQSSNKSTESWGEKEAPAQSLCGCSH